MRSRHIRKDFWDLLCAFLLPDYKSTNPSGEYQPGVLSLKWAIPTRGREERRMKGIRYLADVVVCNEGFFSTVAEKSGRTTGENQNLEWMVGLWQRNQKIILY